MAIAVPLSWLIILTLCLFSAVAFAAVAWMRASASTRPAKQPRSSPATPPSETALARVEADQAELFSTLAKLTTTVKRLSSRAGMQDVRERTASTRDQAPPPKGASKADLLRYYGMSGKVGPDFARAQQQFELRNPEETEH